MNCNTDDLRSVIAWWHQRNLKPRSVARSLVLYANLWDGWLTMVFGRITRPFIVPSLPASLPKSLSEEMRNYWWHNVCRNGIIASSAMLEIMYATGLRVSSWLVCLWRNFEEIRKQLWLEEGGRERMVPLAKLQGRRRCVGLSAVIPIPHLCNLITCFRRGLAVQ